MAAPKYIPWPEAGNFSQSWSSSDGRCCMLRWITLAFGKPHESSWHRALFEIQSVIRRHFPNDRGRSLGCFDASPVTTDREREKVWALAMRRLGYVVDSSAGWPA